MITGGSHLAMKIEVYDDKTSLKVCELFDDSAMLGSYPIDSGMRLHVVDISGWLLFLALPFITYVTYRNIALVTKFFPALIVLPFGLQYSRTNGLLQQQNLRTNCYSQKSCKWPIAI